MEKFKNFSMQSAKDWPNREEKFLNFSSQLAWARKCLMVAPGDMNMGN